MLTLRLTRIHKNALSVGFFLSYQTLSATPSVLFVYLLTYTHTYKHLAVFFMDLKLVLFLLRLFFKEMIFTLYIQN